MTIGMLQHKANEALQRTTHSTMQETYTVLTASPCFKAEGLRRKHVNLHE